MKRIAILDLGTNTFHLLIAESQTGNDLQEIVKVHRDVKIGEGGIANGLITEAAFNRGLDALQYFNSLITEHKPQQVYAVGTAAIRTAKNGAEFIAKVFQETGITIESIPGDKEAQLIYEGVRHAVKLDSTPALIMDIGGGSVEFIIADGDKLHWKKSYPIGAAKLMALYHHTDPISKEEFDKINDFLDDTLADLKIICDKLGPRTLIGSAGAFETFAELEVLSFNLPSSLLKQINYTFNIDQFNIIANDLVQTTNEQRKILPIEPVRIDMIIVATILTQFVLRKLNIFAMKMSSYSLKEGLFFINQN